MTSSSSVKPVQYTKGFVEFYKLKFLIDERVLIPRPETEILVEEAIEEANRLSHSAEAGSKIISDLPYAISILDVGTGSGCIAISIAKNLPDCKITAVDLSAGALNVAKKNAKLHGVSEKIDFLESDLLMSLEGVRKSSGLSRTKQSQFANHSPSSIIPHSPPPLEEGGIQTTNLSHSIDSMHTPPLDAGGGWVGVSPNSPSYKPRAKFDIIVANLPYIPSSRIPALDSSVKDFEPHLALDGGEDGFELYRKLFEQMVSQNIIPRFFMGEIDITQSEIAKIEAKKHFPEANVEIKNDLTKRERFLVIRF